MAPPSKLSTWILAGQSNMEGCGLLDEVDPANATPDPRLWLFSSAGRWEPAVDPLHRLADSFTTAHSELFRQGVGWGGPSLDGVPDEDIPGIAAGIPHPHGAGLGVTFARAMADANGEPVGLIAAAHGGASLEQWSPTLKSEGGRSLYGSMLERVRVARETVDVQLAGILWYQGESDTSDELAASYADRFDRWVAAARADLGEPDLPVYVVQLGRLIVGAEVAPSPGWDVVREAQRTLSQRVAHSGCVTAIDLPLSDPIHISTAGLVRLGRRMAYLALTGTEPQPVALEWGEPVIDFYPTVRVRCAGVTGGWRASSGIPGFALCDESGAPHLTLGVIDAAVDPDDPSTIVVRLSGSDAGACLGYGLGVNPTCTLVDGEDMALPAFFPTPIATGA